MTSNHDHDYSTLEVAPQSVPTSPAPHYQEKQVTPYDPLPEHGSNNKGAYFSEGLEVVPVDGKHVYTGGAADYGGALGGHDADHVNEAATKPNRKKWWIIGGAVLLVVVIAAVVGGVVASRKSSSTTDTTTAPSATASPTSTSGTSSTGTSSIATATATTGIQHSIGAIGWNTSKTAFNRRLYFLDDNSQLTQGLQTADDPKVWQVAGLGVYGKPGTPLGVAVTRPGFTLGINVFYLDNSSMVQQYKYVSGTGFQKLTVPDFQASSTSSLATMFTQCRYCSNSTIMAYQNTEGKIVIANLTGTTWTTETLSLSVVNGTGLALEPFTKVGQNDQINLFRQTSDGVLGLSSWKSGSGWSLSEQTYRKVPNGGDLAVSTYGYSQTASGGFEDWIQLISTNYGILTVDTWSGAKNDWLKQGYQPAAMAVETGPGTTYNFTNVAVDSLGSAYAVGTAGAGLGYQLITFDSADDGVSWVKNNTISSISWT